MWEVTVYNMIKSYFCILEVQSVDSMYINIQDRFLGYYKYTIWIIIYRLINITIYSIMLKVVNSVVKVVYIKVNVHNVYYTALTYKMF